jgi:hypothetical protein
MSTTNTKETKPGMGSKMRGAAQAAHGIGETIRGTILGAIDSIGGDATANKEIAAQGRMEYSQGIAKMRGAGAGATAGYGTGGGTGTGAGAGTGAGTEPVARPGQGYDAGQQANAGGAEASGTGAYDAKESQAGGYDQKPTGYQQNQPMPSAAGNTEVGAGTDTGAGAGAGTQAGQVGSAGTAGAGGPGRAYDANQTSNGYNQQQPEGYQQKEPMAPSSGNQDGGEYQQGEKKSGYPQATDEKAATDQPQ